MTAGIGIACVDGPRPRRSLLTVAGLERLHRSGRVGGVAGWLGPRLNIEPIISISVEGPIDPLARTRGPAAARRCWLEPRSPLRAGRPREPLWACAYDRRAWGDERAAELVARCRPEARVRERNHAGDRCGRGADGTNAWRVRYD